MASISSSILPASSSLTLPAVLNIAMALANTEYVITIPADAKRFRLQARLPATLQISDTPGGSSTTFFTLYPYNTYGVDSLKISSTIDLYIQSTKANQVIELEYWV